MKSPKPLLNRKIKIGSRASPLAIKQVEEVLGLLNSPGIRLHYELIPYATHGDRDKRTPLSVGAADDFFTDTLDSALLKGEIDLAVHSAKDLPKTLPQGLKLFSLTASLDETDSLVAKTKLAQLPVGAKIGTSSLLRREEILHLNPHVQPVDIRGTIEERLALLKEGKLDGLIIATCALKRLNWEHLITEIMPWETTPLQGQLAVVGRWEDLELKMIFRALDVRNKYGRVILVGAGPGDPELITLKAIKALRKADCVFYDYLTDRALLQYAPRAQKIYVGKRKGQHTLSQAELSKMLRTHAMAGRHVVRLKGGDPLIFGRGAEEIQYLRAYHISVEVIPGISSATGISSSLGIPLTARGLSSSVAFLSGHAKEEGEGATAHQIFELPRVDTLVFLMGLTRLNLIIQSLEKAGWKKETPMMVISKGTRRDEKIVSGTLATIEQLAVTKELEPPALIIAGEILRFWNPNPNEKGKSKDRILYVGTNPQRYEILGEIVHFPMIELVPVPFTAQQKEEIIQTLKSSHIVILTSRFAVKSFMAILQGKGGEALAADFKGLNWAVIGAQTASALREYGVSAQIVSEVETSQGLLVELKNVYDLKGKKIFFPRSSLPNPYLKDELTKLGAEVAELAVYENRKAKPQPVSWEGISKILFSSPSTVKNFLESYGVIPDDWQILSRGPLTHRALKEAGYESEIFVEG